MAGSCVLEGSRRRALPQDAALVNGITAHGLELDDTHEESSSHPGVAIWPAILAVAESNGSTMGQLVEAAVVGYDVMCSAGVLLGAAESYGRGFHPTGVAGILGAAAGCARLLGLDVSQTTQALGIAADTASGSLEFLSDGSWTKRLNAGAAASGGVRAALLGRAGFTAPRQSFEGRDGWLVQYGQGAVPGRTLRLELGAGMATTSIKFYPCCRYMHGVMDLMIDLHREYPGASAEDVESVEAAVIAAGQALVSVPLSANYWWAVPSTRNSTCRSGQPWPSPRVPPRWRTSTMRPTSLVTSPPGSPRSTASPISASKVRTRRPGAPR